MAVFLGALLGALAGGLFVLVLMRAWYFLADRRRR